MSLSILIPLLNENGYQICHIDRAFVFAVQTDHATGFDLLERDEDVQQMLDESLEGTFWDFALEDFRGKPVEEILAAFAALFADKPEDTFTLKVAS